MSTRSVIGKLIDGAIIKAIHCHWDGYPEHNGDLLVNHYKDEAKIDALLELGDLSSLGPEIGQRIDFNDRPLVFESQRTQCVAYGRDRKERGTEANVYPNLQYILHHYSDVEYVYIWNGSTWACYNHKGKMYDLTQFKEGDDVMA